MESRRVTLITEGYKLGWLNFKYENPLSRTRENFILLEIEKNLVKEYMKFRAQVDATLVSAAVPYKRTLVDAPYQSVNAFAELTLPYRFKNTKIEGSAPEMSEDDLKKWGEALRTAVDEYNKAQNKEPTN